MNQTTVGSTTRNASSAYGAGTAPVVPLGAPEDDPLPAASLWHLTGLPTAVQWPTKPGLAVRAARVLSGSGRALA
ncbi:hypothetical protein [Streptomyces sp. NPDC058861]|uniref:hypothetical protein n=1 Tax=Streptomyces sp. NPDC058861 TaxID=3346653 RepID=UPI003696BBBD